MLNILLNDQALQYLVELNYVSPQCARGKSSLARKTEVHPEPNIFSGRKTFQKCNPPDIKFYLGKLQFSSYGAMLILFLVSVH